MRRLFPADQLIISFFRLPLCFGSILFACLFVNKTKATTIAHLFIIDPRTHTQIQPTHSPLLHTYVSVSRKAASCAPAPPPAHPHLLNTACTLCLASFLLPNSFLKARREEDGQLQTHKAPPSTCLVHSLSLSSVPNSLHSLFPSSFQRPGQDAATPH